MASESKTTTDHKAIQEWAEARGGKPSTVKSTEKDGEAGVLRIDFPGYSGAGSLEEITWEEFFQKFDEKKLAFLYQEHTSSGEESRFFKLVSRDSSSEKSSAHSSAKSEQKDDAKSSAKTEHKTESKAHKAEHKEEIKSSAKTEHKDDGKAHKAESEKESKSPAKSEHKEDSKAHKAEHKEDSKAHKAEEKSHKTTKK